MTRKDYRAKRLWALQAADEACVVMDRAYNTYNMVELEAAYEDAMQRIDKAMAPFEEEFQFIAKSEVSKCYTELVNELESLYADGLI